MHTLHLTRRALDRIRLKPGEGDAHEPDTDPGDSRANLLTAGPWPLEHVSPAEVTLDLFASTRMPS